jgi:hypothetical protein
MRTPFAFGSLPQHSDDSVLMSVCHVEVTPPGLFQPANWVGGMFAKAEEITVKPIPKLPASLVAQLTREFHCQRSVTCACNVFAKLFLVRREYADAAPATRNRHIPLLRIRGRLNGRVGEQNVVHGLALRTVGRHSVAREKLAEAFIQNTPVRQFNAAIGVERLHRDKLTVRGTPARGKFAIRFEVEPLAFPALMKLRS